ncbi:MAG TPA: hypothetical protein VN673_00070 [Clostridia bacterium]|nr:hypothetical protein [Clostridia bacterium]
MRNLVVTGLAVLVIMLLNGCAKKQPAIHSGALGASGQKSEALIVAPDGAVTGKVINVNPKGRYVIVSFPIGQLPALESRFNVYRRGLKVGEIKVSGPRLDDNIVADIRSGEAAPGDEVRW